MDRQLPKKPGTDFKFLCDEMLQRLGRWLRIAGYDTLIAQAGEADTPLYQQAIKEKRWLITCDHDFMQRRHATNFVVLLDHQGTHACCHQLSTQLPIDWHYKPFSRCSVCNHLLDQSPHAAPNDQNEAWYCPECRKVYWEGSHVANMRKTLEGFANASTTVAS